MHLDLRGVIHTTPSESRTTRPRARPHPASTPEHAGHTSAPARTRSSSASASTVTTAPPSAPHGPPARLRPRISGRDVACTDLGTVAAPINKVNTTRPARTRSARSAAPNRHYIVILSGG